MIAASPDLLTTLPLAQACALLELGRGVYYRSRRQQAETRDPTGASAPERTPEDPALLAVLEAVVLEFPGYGYPRVTAELRRQGWDVNHKRIYRLMGEHGLLQRRRHRRARTTNSAHGLPIYPNLLSDCGWRELTAPNQAWGADLTYVRLGGDFCFLAVLLDLFSRKLVGWDLSRSLEAEGALAALDMALTARQPEPGWIHHSDRGTQYASGDYIRRLQQARAQISMAEVGAPKQNALVERVIRTLKDEEVHLQEYQSLREAKESIGRFIEAVYNQKRLHSALGYRPPSEFEELFAAGLVH